MFQFELHPHIGDIRTDILVYEKGGVTKHIKAPLIVKVEVPNLQKNRTCEEVEALFYPLAATPPYRVLSVGRFVGVLVRM